MIVRFNLQTVRTCGLAALAIALSALVGTPAQAQLNFGAFTLKFCEKEMKFEHPTAPDWQTYLMMDLPFQRMIDRNTPTLELTNNSNSNSPITQFRLTIGDTRFHFANGKMGVFAELSDTTPGIDISSISPTGDELIVNIGDGGLAPGELVRFRIDLDVDAAFQGQFFANPDYRTVLFDMNGMEVYSGFEENMSSADNAKASAIFDPASGPNFTVGPVAIADQTVSGSSADFYNDNYREYKDKDPVRTFLVVGSLQTVPEPGSALLAGVGLFGALLTARRARRTVVSA
jgi:PEP-CTERM motif-containing protein